MANNEDPDQMPRFAASDFAYHIYGTLEKMGLYSVQILIMLGWFGLTTL